MVRLQSGERLFMAKDRFGYNQDMNYSDSALSWALENEDPIRKFLKKRKSTTRTYEDFIRAIKSNEIKFNPIDRSEWKGHSGEFFDSDRNIGAFYNNDTIHFPDDKEGLGSMPHELIHYFASHKPGGRGVPEKINPYIKADMALGGWLPSFHPGGRRPTIPKWMGRGIFSKASQNWNQNYATKDAERSNEEGYHPWFDEQAFDQFGDLPFSLTQQDKPVRMDRNYPVYKKQSTTAQSFRDAFAKHRSAGDKTFTWRDAEGVARKYTTKIKGE